MANEKVVWPGGTLLAPVPVVLVGSGDGRRFPYNLLTVAWAGTVCSEPPMAGVAVRPSRYSFGLIQATGEFTINVPSCAQAKKVDFCGVKSGREVDKFRHCGFTALPGSAVAAPVVVECPLTLECKVERTLDLGAHTLFLGRIVAVQVSADLVRPDGSFDLSKADLLAYAHGNYYTLGEKLGKFGFSVQKKTQA